MARQLRLPVRTVRRLFARFDQYGVAGLAPDYHRRGAQQPSQAPADVIDQVCQLRRQHPTWGAELIRVVLAEGQPPPVLPATRTLRRHLRRAGLQSAPRRPRTCRVPRCRIRAGKPMPSEELRLPSGCRVCWPRVVDECSGAFGQTVVFPTARWQHVDRRLIRESFRDIFRRWGRPQRLRVANGYPWGSTGEFPPELALWLLGLGIEVLWIAPGRPQQNGVVERAQGVGPNGAEPHRCADAPTLPARCADMDRRQRESYPYANGQSRWATFPGLRQSGRRCDRTWEARHWELARVLQALAGTVVVRQVDRQGCVSLDNRTRYVGRQQAGQRVYVALDASGPTWVIAAADGTQLRTLAAEELTAERIRGRTVGGRKGTDKRV